MARKTRLGQRTWHFSSAGNKFDGHPKPARQSSLKPISPTLKRGVIHCKRCGSRVVSNVDNCPFCGRSLRPVFARFWFWLIVVVVVTAGVIWLVNFNLPTESSAPSSPTEPARPQVIGSPEDSPYKELALGTSIDNSGLEVTVNSVNLGPIAANGSQIYVVEIDFMNQNEQALTLYSTQWMLQTTDGKRIDTFVGSAVDGATISSNFEAYELQPQGRFAGRLYFAVAPPASDEEQSEGAEVPAPDFVVYQPSALAYSEELLVTWKVS